MFFVDNGQVEKASDTNHKEFIKITDKNRNELKTFQKRNRYVVSHLKDTFVKFEPRQLAIAGEACVVFKTLCRRHNFSPSNTFFNK